MSYEKREDLVSGCQDVLCVQGASKQRLWSVKEEGDTIPGVFLFSADMEPMCGEPA